MSKVNPQSIVQGIDKLLSEFDILYNGKNNKCEEFIRWSSALDTFIPSVCNQYQSNVLFSKFHKINNFNGYGKCNHREYLTMLTEVKAELEGWKLSILLFEDNPKEKSHDDFNKVIEICHRFKSCTNALKQRDRNRPSLLINDEYDIQYLLNAILCVHFNDVRREEFVPSDGLSSSRIDFLLKEERIAIETKYAKGGNAKSLQDELTIDVSRYQEHPDVCAICCFVFDSDGSITNTTAFCKAIEKLHTSKLSIKVVIA